MWLSSKSLDKEYQETTILDLKEPLKLRNIIIPFSKFSKTQEYIYYGSEKIPFKERHLLYQKIFKNEFTE